MITIIIVEDHPLMRHGISRMLEEEEGMRVIYETGNASDAINAIANRSPHIAIIDIELEGAANGIDLIKSIKSRDLKTASIVLSMHDETLYAEKAFAAGAAGYLTKNEAPQKLVEAVKQVSAGSRYLSPEIYGKITELESMNTSSSDKTGFRTGILTPRETEILEMTGLGFSSTDISRKLNLSINTVETHKKNIIVKLGLNSSRELLKSAIQWVMRRKNESG